MISDDLLLLINMAKVQSLIARKFDALSVHGLGFSDFMILYLLHAAPGYKMRRIDLADKTGLTASGVTRLLSPLEKIGLVAREASERDARVSYVVLTPTGKRVFKEAKVTAEYTAKDLLSFKKNKSLRAVSEMLQELGGNLQ